MAGKLGKISAAGVVSTVPTSFSASTVSKVLSMNFDASGALYLVTLVGVFKLVLH